ncbi:MAG: FecR domain-containing protein [Thermoanaerobaculia bacterium]|nr:FecR domain-containing protein [Thermoanaerobaculia bacterium]
MNAQRPNPEELLDRATAAVRDEAIDPQLLAAARDRVARRLAAELDAPAGAGHEHRIRGCDGFRGLIPAYLAGALATPRRILFEDHTRECVPCRRALADARRGGAAGAGWQTRRQRPAAVRYALAAGLAGLVIAGAAMLSGRLGLVGPDASARVRAIEGELVALDGGAVRPVAAGDEVARGETVRTGSGSGAVFELADGSRVELAARSQLTLARRSDGVVLDLERGALIVEAAEQKRGHLYVRTDDCLVSVVGTIFSVNHGVRGSRVSVLDGEVRVDGGTARHAVLRPGDQLATSAQLGRVALADEIGWSRNAADYRERIAALAALGRELDATLAIGGRTSTALVDRAPADTAIWVGLPNVADELSQAWALVEQRVTENPVLAAWWSERFAGGADAARISETIDHLREFGSHLGEEIAVAVAVDATGEPGAPVVFAEVADAAGFDALVDAEIARLNAEAGAEKLRRVADPSQAAAGEGVLYLWHSADGLFAASTSAARLAELAAGGFAGSTLHGRLAAIYRDGTGWLVGVDAARIVRAAAQEDSAGGAFAALGLADAEQFLLESETVAGATETRAALAFAGARRGAVAWLAAPAPSGALEFVSPAASLVVAGISKRPAEMFDDLLALARADDGAEALAKLAEAESQLGFSLRDDLAAALGGDAAFALDGPLLPTPAWKAVVEVVDPSRLEYAMGRAVEAVNREAAAEGHPGLRFGQEEVDGRRYLTLATDAGVQLAAMSFVDGYLVAAPSRALVVEAIAHRDAGTHLVASQAFRDLLPSDAETDFSALVWQNFGGATGPLGQLLGSALPAAEREQLEALSKEIGPTLVLAYGDADRVRMVARGGAGPLGLSFEKLLALAGVLREQAPEGGDAEALETPVRTTA